MSFEVTAKTAPVPYQHVTIMRLQGTITFRSGGSQDIRDAVTALKHGTNVLVDMTEVSYIDSSGIGALVSASSRVRNRGGELKLFGLQERTETVLIHCGTPIRFDVHNDRDASLASFGPTRRQLSREQKPAFTPT
jgi:anti-sigma B factor antagonist